MKQCARCGQQLNDNEQFCTRCGGNNFRIVANQSQQLRPNNAQQRPMNNGMQQQRTMNGNQQQRPINSGVQQQRPMNNNMKQRNPQNAQQIQMGIQQVNNTYQNFGTEQIQQSSVQGLKPRKMSKKEKQYKEMELMYAKKAANERGEIFDEEKFKQQHDWYEVGGTCDKTYDNLSVGGWIKVLLIMLIPIVNIIVAIIGLKNNSNPEYKRNYYKAFLIYYVSVFVISTLITLLI